MPARYAQRVKILVSFEEEQLKLINEHVAEVARKKAKEGEQYDRSLFIQEAIKEKMEDS